MQATIAAAWVFLSCLRGDSASESSDSNNTDSSEEEADDGTTIEDEDAIN